jgi:D-alanyl-D-alanine carboxypeptidase (penicillin-binding protein 5/6)
MNQKAKEIGLKDSHFASVDGLPAPDHYMTERDLATLALRTIEDFPEYYHYYAEKEFAFNNIKQGNRNPLLYKDIGADGLKTGHTEESGYSLLGSLHRGDRRVILVLSGLPTMKSRAVEGERLAEWAFRDFNDYKLFSAGEKVDDARTWLGSKATVPLTVAKDVVVTLTRKARKDMRVAVDYQKPVAAPVKQGQEMGKITVSAPDSATIEAPLIAAASVDRLGPFGRMAAVAGNWIWGENH